MRYRFNLAYRNHITNGDDMNKVCLECGKQFIADDEKDKFCSEACLEEWEKDNSDDFDDWEDEEEEEDDE